MAGKQTGKSAARTLRSGLYVAGILAAWPADARCHIYTKWHYPWRQHCYTAYAPRTYAKPASRVLETSHERIEIVIPPLEWVPCPIGDEYMQGIAKLKGLM